MDRRRREFQLNVVCSSWSSAAGYLTVLKNNFAGTQAPEMGEQLPLTYFCRSRGTCDVTSARSRPRRLGGTTEVARELQFHVNNLAPLVAVRPPPGEWNSRTWKRSAHAARCHACSASTQPPYAGVERQPKCRRAKGATAAVGCASMAARTRRQRAQGRTRELHLA